MFLFVFQCFSATQSYAAEAILPIRAKIIRCVTQEEIAKECRENQLCCDRLDEGEQSEIRQDYAAKLKAEKRGRYSLSRLASTNLPHSRPATGGAEQEVFE